MEGRTLFGQLVSGNYFTMLGAGVAEGRPLLPRDASAPGSGAVMVVSYDAWKNKFGGDPNLVGKTLHLRGHAFEVVGIASPAFAGLERFPGGFWIPLTMHAAVQDGSDLLAFPQPRAAAIDWPPARGDAAGNREGRADGMVERVRREPAAGAASGGSGDAFLRDHGSLDARRDSDFHPHLYRVRAGAADRLRERVEHDAGARVGAAAGDRHTGIAGGGTGAAGPPTVDRERAAGGAGGGAGIRGFAGDDRRSAPRTCSRRFRRLSAPCWCCRR